MRNFLCETGLVVILIISLINVLGPSNAATTRERISEIKCKEYQEAYREIYYSPLPYPFNDTDVRDLVCPIFRTPLIIGGTEAEPAEFPHMAALMYKDLESGKLVQRCGGSLISENYVLTAAHCAKNSQSREGLSATPSHVLLGDIRLEENPRTEHSSRKLIPIEKIIIHPNYRLERNYHDIALLKLSETFDFSSARRGNKPAIRPACLPKPFTSSILRPASNVTAAGWGGTETEEIRSNVLKFVTLPIVDIRECNETYEKEVFSFRTRFPVGLSNTQLCAGWPSKDTCQGDSGGPITITPLPDVPCMQFVVGITSLGVGSTCGTEIPGIYTNVERYLNWIERIVWGSQ